MAFRLTARNSSGGTHASDPSCGRFRLIELSFLLHILCQVYATCCPDLSFRLSVHRVGQDVPSSSTEGAIVLAVHSQPHSKRDQDHRRSFGHANVAAPGEGPASCRHLLRILVFRAHHVLERLLHGGCELMQPFGTVAVRALATTLGGMDKVANSGLAILLHFIAPDADLDSAGLGAFDQSTVL